MTDFSCLIHGYQKKISTLSGYKRYINFDNAASTPPFKEVMNYINKEAAWYSGVHRGNGYKSRYSTEKYEEARQIIAEFVGADSQDQIVIFTKNTTDSINKVSHYLDIIPGDMVIYTKIEHHSNELPWLKTKTTCIGLNNDEIDLNQLEAVLQLNRGKIKLLAVCGGSNVTGYTPPIYTIAEMAHNAGTKILVDGAQLVPHRQIKLYPVSDPRHIDFLAFSGHKMYAPFGSGVLIGPKNLFSKKTPSQVGGGTIRGLGPNGIIWVEPPEVEEAGSPNVLGALAIAKACQIISSLSWDKITEHENSIIAYALKKLMEVPNLLLYNTNLQNRVGVVSFNIKGLDHYQVAEYLADNSGIGVRNGCFCARGYVQSLLKLDSYQLQLLQEKYINNPGYHLPGMVRISFGCYNKLSEIDLLVESLQELVHKLLVC